MEENQQPIREEKKKPQAPFARLKSKEVLFFPSVDSKSALFPSKRWKSVEKNIRWQLEDIVNFIFPSHTSPVSHKNALEFLKNLLQHPEGVTGDDISDFIKINNFSPATIYNIVIPKLHRCGLIERRRILGVRGRKMSIHISLLFSTHLGKLAEQWQSIVETAKEEAKEKNQYIVK